MSDRVSETGAFRSLAHRSYRLYFFGQLVSMTGTWMQTTAQSWLVYRLTGSGTLLGLVVAAGFFDFDRGGQNLLHVLQGHRFNFQQAFHD